MKYVNGDFSTKFNNPSAKPKRPFDKSDDFGYNGGWRGYVSEDLGSQKDLTLGMIYQNLYSRVDYYPPSAVASGFTTGITNYAFLAANPEAKEGALAVGAITTLLTFFSNTASSGCCGDSCTIS
jgi:hypothetical protein